VCTKLITSPETRMFNVAREPAFESGHLIIGGDYEIRPGILGFNRLNVPGQESQEACSGGMSIESRIELQMGSRI
jgi:hypothetical protein